MDTTHANARDDIVRSFKGMLGIGIRFEMRAKLASLAHRFRDPLHRFQALQICIPKCQLVQLYAAAKACQAVDQEWGPNPRGSDESDLHDGVMSSRTISRRAIPMRIGIRLALPRLQFSGASSSAC